MDIVNNFFLQVSTFLWGWPMIVMLLGTHLFLTFRLRIPQRRLLTGIRLSVSKDDHSQGDVSQFGALVTSLAATIGTGNIVGVATAVALGGPGAVLWCWLTGVFGIATKYAEGLLAVRYRVHGDDGHIYGGPMYALERGLGMKWMGMLFALFTALASFGIGGMVQANSIALMTEQTLGVSPWLTGGVVCTLIAAVIIGGLRSIARVCSVLVPFMAMFYVAGCCLILCLNYEYLWPAMRLIVVSAFQPEAAGGGFVGASVMMAARYGIARGLFSNESGMGSAPIVAAAAQTRNPVRQALVSSTGTFWDTVVVCAITGLVVVSSVLAHPDISYDNGAVLTHAAFAKIPVIGAPLLTFSVLTFAFSTILGWYYYGQSAVRYLGRYTSVKGYRTLYLVAVFVGSVYNLEVVWNFADCMNALMALPNLIGLLLLSGVIARDTDYYLWGHRLDERASDDGAH